MFRWLAPAALSIAFAILAYGVGVVLYENVKVAPLAEQGGTGRLHPHMKNVTRLGGDAEAVRAAASRAAYLDAEPPVFAADDWRAAIRAQIAVRPDARHLVVLPGDDAALPWALPGAYWAIYAGSPVVFARSTGLSPEDLALAQALSRPAFVLAPEEQVPDEILAPLAGTVPVRRVAGGSLAEHAVKIALFRDPDADFGWGRTVERRNGYFHYAIAPPADAASALAASPLAWTNAAAFLFAEDGGGLPAETDAYLWSMRSTWAVTPSEGPFHHLWLLGDRISYGAQGRADLSVEKAGYLSHGSVALGPLEGLAIVFIALGVAGAVFVGVHGNRQLPQVMPATRAGWVGCALLLPVVGVILYLAAYRRPVMDPRSHMLHWRRPSAIQAASATAVAFGYGATFMIAVAYLVASAGFPLFFGAWADGWEFLYGAGMPIMMAAMYVGAILLVWPIVQTPMRRMAGGGRPILSALGVTILSMSAVSLGMMTVSWLMMMEKIEMMPDDDEILWFGAMWLAATIGFFVAWPLNWPMVRLGLKPGAM